MFYSPWDDVLFIHIPKNAGTAIRLALYEAIGDKDRPPQVYRMENKRHRVGVHAQAYKIRPRLDPIRWRNIWKFAVVRNPWERLVSLWKFGTEIDHARHQVSARREMREPLNRIRRGLHHLNLPPYKLERIENRVLGNGFKYWLLEFCEEYRWTPWTWVGDQTLSLTRAAQCDWICENGKIVVDRVYQFEDLVTLEIELADRFGGFRLGKANTTEHEHYSKYYDDETRDWVAKVHAQDIERFEYRFETA